jgi:hypothetical protein
MPWNFKLEFRINQVLLYNESEIIVSPIPISNLLFYHHVCNGFQDHKCCLYFSVFALVHLFRFLFPSLIFENEKMAVIFLMCYIQN